MYSSIEEYKVAIENALENLSKDINSINKKEPSRQKFHFEQCQKQAIAIKEDIDALEIEIINASKHSTYSETLKKLRNRLKQVKTVLDFLQRQKANILKTDDLEVTEKKDLKNLTPFDLERIGSKYQEKSIKKLEEIKVKIASSHEKADTIAISLDEQTKKMEQAQVNTLDIKYDLKKGKAIIRYFSREIWKDRLTRILLILVILALLAVIFLKLYYAYWPSARNNSNEDPIDKIEKFSQ
jgi:hypothetical protein